MTAILICLTLFLNAINADIAFNIQILKIKKNIPELYTGIGLDWWRANDTGFGKQFGNAGMFTLDLNNQNLITLTSSIAPSILRLGGSPENAIVYDITDECGHLQPPGYDCPQIDVSKYYGCLNMSRWEQVLQFALKTNVSFVFGLNPCYGRPTQSESQNFSNIESLMKYTVNNMDKKYVKAIYGFEYGNELALRIDPEIYSKDLWHLNQLINTYFDSESRPKLIAPDIYGEWSSWYTPLLLNDLMENYNDTSFLNGFTYHEYPECGYNPDLNRETVLDLYCLEQIPLMAKEYSNFTRVYDVKTFMGEGALHSGGGSYNISDTFISSFYYVYALSEYINSDIYLVIRECLVGGYYELINHVTFEPNPDFWMLWMFKMFVGDKLYESQLIDNGNQNGKYVKGYSFRLKNDTRNGVAVILINFGLNDEEIVDINVIDSNGIYQYDEYHVVGIGYDGLQTRQIEVNGQPLEFKNNKFPELQPISGTGPVTIKPKSIVFVSGVQL